MKSLSTNDARGRMAEIYAALYLFLKGYRLLKWRYKTPVGEIDLIAERGGVTVFVEIKLRPTTEEALASITPAMRSRISRAAGHYLASRPSKNHKTAGEYRFDVIAISGFRVWHLDNAWFPPT